MQRNQIVPPSTLSGNANVTYYATDPSAADKDARALPPHAIQLRKEVLVLLEMAHLIGISCSIFLQRPIWWRGDNQMDRVAFDPGEITGIAQMKAMSRSTEGLRPRNLTIVSVSRKKCLEPFRRVVFGRQRRRPALCSPSRFFTKEGALRLIVVRPSSPQMTSAWHFGSKNNL